MASAFGFKSAALDTEYPYRDFKPTTKINAVIKVEVCLAC